MTSKIRKLKNEERMAPILRIVAEHPQGIRFDAIKQMLDAEFELGVRAVQYRLRVLVSAGRIEKQGVGKGTRYFPTNSEQVSAEAIATTTDATTETDIRLSSASLSLIEYLKNPMSDRTESSFNAEFVDSYKPNKTNWFSDAEKTKLRRLAGGVNNKGQPAGTYARRLMDRLLIDLSWNSSRLEGNTYSLLDTRRLLEFSERSDSGSDVETQMILNHRDAIEFLVEDAENIDFDPLTIRNLHALLADNLLANPMSAGSLRQISVGISGCTYNPLDVPQLIDRYFELILEKARETKDPFEQALMILAFLPYLQPFDDVNKRVSRLAANIPLIKLNLVPISFVDVSTDLYVKALMSFYELRDVSLLKELFIWAYTRSALNYAAVQQQLGAPDPFRMKYRTALLTLVRDIVTTAVPRSQLTQEIQRWTLANIHSADQEKFQSVVNMELHSLHEGNFARYRIRQSEFEAWRKTWARN